MVYERYPRSTGSQGDQGGDAGYGQDYGSGRDYTYSSARDYAAAGRLNDGRYGRQDQGRPNYGGQRYDQRGEQRGAAFDRDREDYRGGYGRPERSSDWGHSDYGRDDGGQRFQDRGDDRYSRGQRDEYRGSYASDGRRFENVGRDRHADDDQRRDRDGGRGYGRQPQGYDYEERGFFQRAGDEVRSWFGDDDAERRREADSRYDDRAYRNGGQHDDHYGNWRSSQIAAFDRDYDEYRNENRSRFETEFSNWRTNRQTQRDSLNKVKEHQEVVGSDGTHVGTVDKVRGDRILLTKNGLFAVSPPPVDLLSENPVRKRPTDIELTSRRESLTDLYGPWLRCRQNLPHRGGASPFGAPLVAYHFVELFRVTFLGWSFGTKKNRLSGHWSFGAFVDLFLSNTFCVSGPSGPKKTASRGKKNRPSGQTSRGNLFSNRPSGHWLPLSVVLAPQGLVARGAGGLASMAFSAKLISLWCAYNSGDELLVPPG